MSTISKKIANLEAEIRKHLLLYHDLNKPEISDAEFDKLYEQLQKLAPDSPVLSERGQYDGDFKHDVPMGSLPKVKTVEDLYKKFKGKWVTVSPKIDGAGLSIHFEGSVLLRAVTRGKTDTQKGKNVTVVIPAIPSIPNCIDTDEAEDIRGEVVILKDDWKTIEHLFKNARNAASGGLGARKINEVKERKLTFIAYKLVKEIPSGTHVETLMHLEGNGFKVPDYQLVQMTSLEVAQEIVDDWAEKRKNLPYETDGIVIRLNDEKEFSDAGMTGVYWNGGYAFKFGNESANSKVTNIIWETGRLGFICPVAIFDPIELGGSTITRCTLNNPTWMKENGNPTIGSDVIVAKMNDIIPNVTSVLSSGTGKTNQPTHCPSCGSLLAFAEVEGEDDGAKLKCFNVLCPARTLGTVLNLLRKLEVKGTSDKTLEKIYEAGLIIKPWDIFTLTQEQLIGAGMGKVESKNLVNSLKGLEAKASNLLAGCGVELWGRRMFCKLQSNCPDFTDDRLLAGDFKYDELISVHEVKGAKAKILSEAFSKDGYGRQFLVEILKYVKPIKAEAKVVGGKLSGLSFCLSGSMPRGKAQIEQDIVAAGGSISSGVSKKLSALIAGDGSGSKSEKAIALGVKILTEDELYQLMNK
jgi:DNA ligase (NAD+)